MDKTVFFFSVIYSYCTLVYSCSKHMDSIVKSRKIYYLEKLWKQREINGRNAIRIIGNISTMGVLTGGFQKLLEFESNIL
jgi:hypothetical protein